MALWKRGGYFKRQCLAGCLRSVSMFSRARECGMPPLP